MNNAAAVQDSELNPSTLGRTCDRTRAEVVSTHQKAADGGVDLPEDVAGHVQGRHQGQLQGVVHHHADEHDVARVLKEDAAVTDGAPCDSHDRFIINLCAFFLIIKYC